FAPRYESTVDSLEHQDYVAHGAIGKTLHLEPAKAAAVRRSYDTVCMQVWKFLDTYLRQDAQAKAWLQGATRFRPGRPAPPTGRQIVKMFDVQGPDKTRELLERLDADVDRDSLLQAGNILSAARRADDAVTVYTWATEIFPNSAQAHQALGDALKIQ